MISFRKKNTQLNSQGSSQHLMFIGWKNADELEIVKQGKSKDADEVLRFLHLQSLVEQGIAQWEPADSPRGCLIEADEGCLLSPSLQELLRFPQPWSGSFKLIAPYATHEKSFIAKMEVILANGYKTKRWTRKGCYLNVSSEEYTLSSQELRAIQAFEEWESVASEDRNEAVHQIFLAKLQKSTQDLNCDLDDGELNDNYNTRGARIDIGFSDLEFGQDEWEISIKKTADGGIQLVPTPASMDSIDPDNILKRLSHIKYGGEQATLRINKRIITLSTADTKRTRELLKRGRLNAKQAAEFIEDPVNYMADFIFDPDEIEWSPRVKGLMEWTGSVIDSNVDGGMGMETLGVEPKEKTESNKESDDEGNNENAIEPVTANHNNFLPYPHLNLDADEFSECLARDRVSWGTDNVNVRSQELDLTVFNEGIALKSHQTIGVQWMQAHARAIDSTAIERSSVGLHFADNRGGVLLADDMGLGKTISVLAYISMRQKALLAQNKSGAYLVIAPVSLLLNWKVELERFFKHEELFKKTIILHTDHDLHVFRTAPNSIDTIGGDENGENFKVKTFGLRTQNSDTAKGIDEPGNIVFTNYETVRKYRFSMCAAKWEVMALDEAQYTKNPNIMSTAAVKSLDAKFRILMTGTPVENSLVDFWCLNDTHSPGLLCSLNDFRKNYISRLSRADCNDSETRKLVAAEIKKLVGDTMLRRMKKDILDRDFPDKIEHHFSNEGDQFLRTPMSGNQLEKYEAIRLRHKDDNSSEHHLSLLYQLRLCSLHPDIGNANRFPIGKNAKEAKRILSRSIKGRVLLENILPRIEKNRGEKVLIFALSKDLQWGLARNLEKIYNIDSIPIINGDTKIKSTKVNPSRQKLIEDFENKEGFNICILSPIAAGVGLTITAANHVVHFERHWNPAKEAQATDRAYRIGQDKDVHVWYPMAIHPNEDVVSFDLALDQLMQRKVQLQDSVLNVEDVTVGKTEILAKVFGNGEKCQQGWTTERLKRLTPLEFEALIACLYEKAGATHCQLTKLTGDKGADIVAFNYPIDGENTLIDAKHTVKSEKLASSEGIKQVSHARNQYEAGLGKTFSILQVVTNRPCAIERVNLEAENSDVEIVFEDTIIEFLMNYPVSDHEIDFKLAASRLSL